MGFFEGIEFFKVFNLLPFFKGVSFVENFFVNLQKRCLLNITIVIGFIMLLKQERLEVDDELKSISFSSSNTGVLDNPVIIKETELIFEKFFDLRPGRVGHEFFGQVFNILFGIISFGKGEDGSSITEVSFTFRVLDF